MILTTSPGTRELLGSRTRYVRGAGQCLRNFVFHSCSATRTLTAPFMRPAETTTPTFCEWMEGGRIVFAPAFTVREISEAMVGVCVCVKCGGFGGGCGGLVRERSRRGGLCEASIRYREGKRMRPRYVRSRKCSCRIAGRQLMMPSTVVSLHVKSERQPRVPRLHSDW